MIPVFDGHIDSLQVLYLSEDGDRSLLKKLDKGHFDLPRARQGNFVGGFFAIFVPPKGHLDGIMPAFPGAQDDILKPIDPAYARKIASKGVACLHRLSKDSAGLLRVARTIDDIVHNMRDEVISAVMHFEGAEPVKSDLSNLEAFYDAGLRSLGLVWSRPNAFGYGVNFKFPSSPDMGPGLTDKGKALVKACNRLGIVVDLSHLNEKGFWDVARISNAPLVATHSCMHAITPTPRNLTDKQLDAVRDSKGAVGINFCTGFLREDAKLNPDTPVSQIVRHISYAVDRMGIDHVAIGSDFDGAQIPDAIGDVAGLSHLTKALLDHGFDVSEVMKIACENWMRVLKQTW